jgi:hypothetical protein
MYCWADHDLLGGKHVIMGSCTYCPTCSCKMLTMSGQANLQFPLKNRETAWGGRINASFMLYCSTCWQAMPLTCVHCLPQPIPHRHKEALAAGIPDHHHHIEIRVASVKRKTTFRAPARGGFCSKRLLIVAPRCVQDQHQKVFLCVQQQTS